MMFIILQLNNSTNICMKQFHYLQLLSTFTDLQLHVRFDNDEETPLLMTIFGRKVRVRCGRAGLDRQTAGG